MEMEKGRNENYRTKLTCKTYLLDSTLLQSGHVSFLYVYRLLALRAIDFSSASTWIFDSSKLKSILCAPPLLSIIVEQRISLGDILPIVVCNFSIWNFVGFLLKIQYELYLLRHLRNALPAVPPNNSLEISIRFFVWVQSIAAPKNRWWIGRKKCVKRCRSAAMLFICPATARWFMWVPFYELFSMNRTQKLRLQTTLNLHFIAVGTTK